MWSWGVILTALLLVPRAVWAQGNPLGPEFRVNTHTTGLQAYPRVAADSAGNFVVVWRSDGQDGSGYGVFGQRYVSSGAALGPEFRVNTYTTGPQFRPSVGSDASGNFVVVWVSNTQGELGVFGQRYASSGAPLGPEFRVDTPFVTVVDQGLPGVASDSSGNFVVVWPRLFLLDQEGWNIIGQRYASSGAPLGPEFRVNTYATGDQRVSSVAGDLAGNFVVVWISPQDGSLDGFGQRYASSGVPLGSEFRVNSYTTGARCCPAVAADPSGNFFVTWTSDGQDGSGYGVFGQRYASSGAALGPEFRVNAHTTGHQLVSSVAGDLAGNFVVVWNGDGQDGSSFGVLGQRYVSSGVPLGPEFRVNTYTTGNQPYPSVAASSANFVVVWSSSGQDGSSYGVFGQRYGQIVPVELMRFGIE